MPSLPDIEFEPNDFVHLHLHTDYSLLQSTVQLKPLSARLTELGLKACAITDYGNIYGAVSFFNAMAGKGIKPIIGTEAFLTLGSRHDKTSAARAGERPFYNILLLAKDLDGYHDLVHLSSKAFTQGMSTRPRIDLELLTEYSSGIIAISCLKTGLIGHFLEAGEVETARANANKLIEIFGTDRLFLEINDTGRLNGDDLIEKTAGFSKEIGVGLVATNDVHYLTREDAQAQEVLVAIGEGRTVLPNRVMSDVDSRRYLRSAQEMWDIFGDSYPDALTNTVKIAEMCTLEIPQGDDVRQLPDFPIPPGGGTLDEYFETVLNIGFEERRAEEWDPQIAAGTLTHTIEEYRERLNIEIATIRKMGFPGYFLIVWDFIKYAQDQGIPVGPGRGSAAGSLAAYCLRITDVDPLQYELLFERFLNPERISMPDIDIDFCIRGRGQVIEHVSNLYGRDSVCQIITFGTMASRAAIKDVGRALNLPYGDVEKIAKMIPPPVRGRNVSISKALETVPELIAAVKAEPRIKELVDLALRVEGCARHTSVHAAGVVISPKPLDEIVPIAVSAKEELTSQYPMNDLEKVGMLKMDFLGLTTLTVIADCLASMKEKLGVEIDWAKIPTNDPKTMQLFADGRTEAIFQFESSGMQDMCRRLKPGELEDLSALNALYRPGPLDGGMIDDFIDRHRGIKPVEYLLPEMEEILGNTFGVLVYQEQIMQLAQKLAGYSLGDADLMRRAMGKKKIEEMLPHEEKFIKGAIERKIERKTAKEIYDLMAKFADYGFNRSHSMAYAVLAFRTAYLKAHYPAYFYASVLSHEAQDATKVYKYTSELRTLGLELLPPDINESDDGFTPVGDTVRYGLTAIKGLGQSSVAAIVEARAMGPFTSLFDFCSRIRTGAVNKRGLESLIVSGAFDSIRPESLPANLWRPRLFAAIDSALQFGQRAADDRQRGQSGLFGEADGNDAAEIDELLPVVEAWTTGETAKREKDALGLYISAHPLDNFAPILTAAKIKNFGDLGELNSGDIVRVAGMISGLQIRTSKRGNRFATFRLEDRSGGLKGVAVGENLAKYITYLKDDELVISEGKIEAGDGQDPTLMINDVKGLEDALAAQARSVRITLPADIRTPEDIEKLFAIVDRHSNGRCGMVIDMVAGGVAVRLESKTMLIEPGRAVQRELESRGCIVEWQH
jgi:DNA polymerase III subunit alpha